jgi:hypothetical protein
MQIDFGAAMPTHAELVELAKMCAFNARAANNERVARELRRMAREYQEKAAELDSGRLTDAQGLARFLGRLNHHFGLEGDR